MLFCARLVIVSDFLTVFFNIECITIRRVYCFVYKFIKVVMSGFINRKTSNNFNCLRLVK